MARATFLILSLLLIILPGCGSESNPMGPSTTTPDPEPEIRTPVSFRVSKIAVRAFGGKNGDGSWDASITVSKRRPDIYVQLHNNSASASPNYVSDVRDDAFSGAPYDFTASSSGTGLPKTFPVGNDIIVRLYDQDLGADDYMGGVSFNPLDAYRNDNSTGFHRVMFGSNGTKFVITGGYVY